MYQTALLEGFEYQIQNPIFKDLLGDYYYKADKQKEVMGTPEYIHACEKKIRELAADPVGRFETQSIIEVAINKVKGEEQQEVDLDELLEQLNQLST